jgi:hypothetical protein
MSPDASTSKYAYADSSVRHAEKSLVHAASMMPSIHARSVSRMAMR